METILLAVTRQIDFTTSDLCLRLGNFAGNVSNSQQHTASNRQKKKWYFISLVLLLAMLPGFLQQSFAQTVVTNPASPWTVPEGVTSVLVEVWGGGGAGGGAQASLGTSYGSGGGGGAYNVNTLTVSPGQTYTITVGTGGTAASDANGGNGTASSVSGPGGTVAATFGAGGARRGGAAGAGGTGFNNGGTGGLATSAGAGGGGGAGNAAPTSAGNGGNGSNTAAGSAGLGALPGGAGGGITNSSGAGKAGTAPGGGGGGGYVSLNFAQAGGAGGAGQVVLTYTVCIPPSAPTVTSQISYCQNITANQLSATGSNLLWYPGPTGGTGSSTSPIPSTTSVGTTSYYVSQTVGCEGPRAQIDVIVNPLPSASVAGQSDITCFAGNDGSITIGATGGTGPYFYSVTDGNTWTPAASNPPFTFGGLVANTPYRIKVKDSNGCISK